MSRRCWQITAQLRAETSESGLLGDIEENNPHRLGQRQKQIDYGKNTAGYEAYIAKVPK